MIRHLRYHLLLLFLIGFSESLLGQAADPGTTAAAALDVTRNVVRSIQVTGHRKTKEYIILREVTFLPGASYTLPEILNNIHTSRQNLINTALFVDVTVTHCNWMNDTLDIMVDVKERWYVWPFVYFKPVDRNWNVWINQYNVSLERINYGVKLQANNITGRNDKLNVWLINGYSRQVQLNYYNPYIDPRLIHGLGFDFSYARNREINYSTRENKQAFYKDESKFLREQLYFGLTYSYRKGSINRHTVKLGYVIDNVDDTVLHMNPKFFNSAANTMHYPEIRYRYQHLNVDYIPYPFRGQTLEFNFLKRGWGGPMNIWQFNARASKHIPLKYKFYYSLLGEAGIKFPFNQPFVNLPFLGYGDAFLRGLEYYVVDGVAGGFVRNTIRKEVGHFNLKTGLRSRTYGVIPFRFYLKGYADVGYVYDKYNSTGNILNNRLLYTAGIGFDVLTIYDWVIRLEYSFNQLHERAFFFHKTSFY